jgi:hypothetical protein
MRVALRRLARASVALVVVAALGGCGGDQPTMPDAAAIELGERVRQVRGAAEAGDLDTARARLEEIRTATDGLLAGGEISESRADLIAGVVGEVEQGLGLLATTTTRPPATSAPPATAPADPLPDPSDDPTEDTADDGGDDDGGDDDGDRGGDSGGGNDDDDEEEDQEEQPKTDKDKGRDRDRD